MSKVRLTVAYFGEVRACAGISEENMELPAPASLEQLFSKVIAIHPGLAEMRMDIEHEGILYPLVNGTWVSKETELKDSDKVALLPAVGGG